MGGVAGVTAGKLRVGQARTPNSRYLAVEALHEAARWAETEEIRARGCPSAVFHPHGAGETAVLVPSGRPVVFFAPEFLFDRDNRCQIQYAHAHSPTYFHLKSVRQQILVSQSAAYRPQDIEVAASGDQILMTGRTPAFNLRMARIAFTWRCKNCRRSAGVSERNQRIKVRSTPSSL